MREVRHIGSGSALGIRGSGKHGIRLTQHFRAGKAESLPPSSEHRRSRVTGGGGSDDDPSRTVVLSWGQFCLHGTTGSIWMIVMTGTGGYYWHLVARGQVHF